MHLYGLRFRSPAVTNVRRPTRIQRIRKGPVCDTHAQLDAWVCTYVLSLNSPQLVKSNIARRFRGEIARRKGWGTLSSDKDGLVERGTERVGGRGKMRV